MKKYIVATIAVISIVFTTTAQSREKVKGNRNVTVQQTYVDDFESLVIKNNFEVSIAFNSKPSVEIEADSNLHEFIDVAVVNGVLSISTDYRIASKKKLEITVYYGTLLHTIELYDDAELRSLTSMELDNAYIKTAGNSRAYLNVKSSQFDFTATDKSKSRLNIVSDSTSVILSDNSKLEALLTSKASKFDIYQRADASIEGDTETATFRIDNSGKFYGKNFVVKDAQLLIESSSDATLFIENALDLEASGSSETYIYGDPKINLNTFSGTAKLQKKDINDKGLF